MCLQGEVEGEANVFSQCAELIKLQLLIPSISSWLHLVSFQLVKGNMASNGLILNEFRLNYICIYMYICN